MSCRDAFSYLAKMTGLTPKTVGKAIQSLVDKEVIWLAVEGERVLLRKARRNGRKHILLIGLGVAMVEEGD
jgi:DNA-binding MarR family transcriptional regulator